jgi:RNA-directed DNA polymerase
MSLQTPDAIRTLQRKLYGKAKAEPGFRFYLLYDKVWRADILRHAYDRARANNGAPGVDGVTFDQIETAGLENWLTRLGEELRAKTYQCQPVRRVMIPKPGGGERPLGIPTIRDRVVQTAAKLMLEPIFETDLDPAAFGYRPERSAGQAIQLVLTLLRQGYVALPFEGSSSISVQAYSAFAGQDAELTTLSAPRAQALRGRQEPARRF